MASTSKVAVNVRKLCFSFPGATAPAITDVSFEMAPGESLALIGPSGAGKTTIVNLVMGFLMPDSGEVEINNVAPHEFIAQHPGVIGYVPQFPNLIRGSVAENVALGVPPADVDGAWLREVLSVAQLTEWCGTLAKGADTEIQPRSLSGGQIQRLGIARALYTRPRFLVMDEPTGALDGQTEKALSEALLAANQDMTTLTIAHRLSTIEKSDKVLYLVDGKIQGSGTLSALRKINRDVENLAQQFSLKEIN